MEIQTVCGRIKGEELGITLTHEHLHMQFECVHQPNPKGLKYPEGSNDTFLLKNLGILRQYPYSSHYNIHLDDADTKGIMLDELSRYKEAGGVTIVENTVEGISRNVPLLKELSEQSGIHIIAGTGFYVNCSQTEATLQLTTEQIHDIMLKELRDGVGETGIRCGIVGEIGSSWPIEDFEKRVIIATAQIQQEVNFPISFHPGRHPQAPFEILRIFTEAGGNPEDVIMSHLDRTFYDEELLLEFAKFKTFCQFDLFGTEVSYYQLAESIDMLSDSQRMDKLKVLKDNGHLNQITVSHDLHTKHRLANFGGHGYAHILQNVVPKMKSVKEFTQSDIDQVLIYNPKRWLSRGSF